MKSAGVKFDFALFRFPLCMSLICCFVLPSCERALRNPLPQADQDSQFSKKKAKTVELELTPELEICLQEQKIKDSAEEMRSMKTYQPCTDFTPKKDAPWRENLCMLDLHTVKPTQVGVGLMQVEFKRYKLLTKLKKKKLADYLKDKPVPVVRGPHRKLFLIDHHHLSRALLELKYPVAYGFVVADLSLKSAEDFWDTMQRCKWVYPRKPDGSQVDPLKAELPDNVLAMVDDPYRSLAGFVRQAEGFNKVEVPFVEFEWARFFRTELAPELARKKIKEADIESNFEKVYAMAYDLAKSERAQDMPGHLSKPQLQKTLKQESSQSPNSAASETTVSSTSCAETGAGIPEFRKDHGEQEDGSEEWY